MGKRRILVCGGRAYGKRNGPERRLLFITLNRLHAERAIGAIVHGDAGGTYLDDHGREITFGADKLAGLWARASMIPVEVFAADWGKHGNAAGPIRNQEMADTRPELVIAFPGGRGTADMVRRAKAGGIEVIEVPAAPVEDTP